MTPLQLKNLITKTLNAHKAEEIVSINISKLTSIADYMVICSATSPRHIKALTNYIITTCKERNIRTLGSEGTDGMDEWALIDFGDVIVNIMLASTREFYNLEKLWQVKSNKKINPEKPPKPAKTKKENS